MNSNLKMVIDVLVLTSLRLDFRIYCPDEQFQEGVAEKRMIKKDGL